MKINKYYVAGIIETKGCFIVKKQYYAFRIPVSKNLPSKIRVMDNVFKHLKEKHDINFHKYKLSCSVTYDVIAKADLQKLINFIKHNCMTTKKWQVYIERRIQ